MSLLVQHLSLIIPRTKITEAQLFLRAANRAHSNTNTPLINPYTHTSVCHPATNKLTEDPEDFDFFDDEHQTQQFLHKWFRREFRKDNGYFVLGGGMEYYDSHLYLISFMSWFDAEQEINHWTRLGLSSIFEENDKRVWLDICAVKSMDGPADTCDWIDYDLTNNSVQKAGAPKQKPFGGYQDYQSWYAKHEHELQDSDI